MLEKIKIKHIHIAILILGSLFLLLPILHNTLWFDEAYSVGIASHSFKDIWVIGGHDVHPILYYWVLHILYLLFKNNYILVYRLFSWICISLLGIVGYTHIKKDFSEKTGAVFSFLVYFLPVSGLYSGEIRMYTFGMLLGTLMSIYAYRIYKNTGNKHALPIFGICSLALSYTHYYGLMFAGIVNLVLFIYLLRNKEDRKKDLKKFIITAIIQVVLYIPWLIYFAIQISTVSGGFWITLTFPRTLYELLTVQYYGKDIFITNTYIIFVFLLTILLYAYTIYLMIKNKSDNKDALIAIILYLSVIGAALLISLIMSPILYWRYLLIVTGLLIFYLSYTLSKGNKYIVVSILLCIFLLSSYSMNITIEEVYDESNDTHINYIAENYENGDIFLYSNISSTAIMERMARTSDVKAYYYSTEFWTYEAYKAFEPYMTIIEDLDELKDYKGRIWIIESNTSALMEDMDKQYDIDIIESIDFVQKYKDLSYRIELVEKR